MIFFKYGKDRLTAGSALALARGEMKGVLDLDTIQKIQQSASTVSTLLERKGEAVYGVNTGFGPLCTVMIPQKDVLALQRNLLISHSVGVGCLCDALIVKLMLITKVHALSFGYSGITLETLERILWHIDHDVIPVVPSQGSVGASGDLAPLSHCFLPLIGLGEASYKGQIRPASEVLKLHELEPLTLKAKEGLALINGTQFIAAHAICVIEKMYFALTQADITGAMMVEALSGSASPFDPDLHRLRAFKGNRHVAERLYHLIHGSEINVSHIDCDRVQDPYSLRCMPQVHGTSRDVWLHLKERTETEINSVTDNPVIFEREKVISGGSFHGQPLALTLDYTCLAVSEIGSISERRTYLSLEGKTSGVPKLLIKDEGINSGFMIPQYTSAALVSENKTLCYPASADSIPTSLGQEDHVSMGSISGRKALQVTENVLKILGIELMCVAQAMDFKRPLKTHPILEAVLEKVRSEIPHVTHDVLIGEYMHKAISLIHEGTVASIVKNKILEGYENFRTEYDELFEVY